MTGAASKPWPTELRLSKGGKALTTEVNQWGHHDFWFYNDSKQNVTVGLLKKGCTCSEVDVSLASEKFLS